MECRISSCKVGGRRSLRSKSGSEADRRRQKTSEDFGLERVGGEKVRELTPLKTLSFRPLLHTFGRPLLRPAPPWKGVLAPSSFQQKKVSISEPSILSTAMADSAPQELANGRSAFFVRHQAESSILRYPSAELCSQRPGAGRCCLRAHKMGWSRRLNLRRSALPSVFCSSAHP